MATRTCKQRKRSVGQENVLRPPLSSGAIAYLFGFLIFWAIISEPSKAGALLEAKAPDPQIGRLAVGNPPSATNQATLRGRIQSLILDADRNCVSITAQSPKLIERPLTNEQLELEAALQTVQQSQVGAWLVQVATARRVTLCLDHTTSLEAHYRSHLRLLGLNAKLSQAGRIVFLAHELAHVPQHPQFSNNRRFSPSDMLLLQRVREAAAEAVATRVLWQLRLQGITAPWQEKLKTAYHDIAGAFEATMDGQHGIAQELWATRSAFHRWFEASWRLEIYDDLMLKTLSRIANDSIGLIPTSRHLSDRYLRSIANYGGQGFLIGGDGQTLIQSFNAQSLPANGQARLDTLLERTETATGPTFSLRDESETLSALSPGPKMTSGK